RRSTFDEGSPKTPPRRRLPPPGRGPWNVTGTRTSIRSPGVILTLVLVPLAIATAIGLVALWPDGEIPDAGIVDVGAEFRDAEVVSARPVDCEGANEDRRPD